MSTKVVVGAFAVMVLLALPAAAQTGPGGTAVAALHDRTGRLIGRADLRETPHGVLIVLKLDDAPAGVHALHIHGTGRCVAPDFSSAGGHFDPDHRRHGFVVLGGPHAGDLPNVHVPESGSLVVELMAPRVVLAPAPHSLFDADGAALVLHAGRDDYVSEPAGEAGNRIACGVVMRPPG